LSIRETASFPPSPRRLARRIAPTQTLHPIATRGISPINEQATDAGNQRRPIKQTIIFSGSRSILPSRAQPHAMWANRRLVSRLSNSPTYRFQTEMVHVQTEALRKKILASCSNVPLRRLLHSIMLIVNGDSI